MGVIRCTDERVECSQTCEAKRFRALNGKDSFGLRSLAEFSSHTVSSIMTSTTVPYT